MDSKGHLYQETPEGKLFREQAKNLNEVKERPPSLKNLTPEQYAKVQGMNRAERRKFYREELK